MKNINVLSASYPRFDEDDTVLDDIGENCDDEDWPQIFMAGTVTIIGDDEGCIAILLNFLTELFIKIQQILTHSFCPHGVVSPN